MHLETTPEMADEFVKLSEQAIEQMSLKEKLGAIMAANPFMEALKQAKRFFPQAYEKGNKSITDVVVNKLGEKSGILKYSGITKNANGEVIAEGKGVLAGNAGGVKTKFVVDIPYANTAINTDAAVLKGAAADPAASAILPNVKYNVENGSANLSLSRVKGKGYDVAFDVKAPEAFLNEQVKAGTGGEFETFGEMLDMAKKISVNKLK